MNLLRIDQTYVTIRLQGANRGGLPYCNQTKVFELDREHLLAPLDVVHRFDDAEDAVHIGYFFELL